jgi:ribosome-binding factor A
MTTRRQERVAERIHEEVGNLLLLEIKDPRVANVNVVDVVVTPDIKLAKIYVTVLGDEQEHKQAMEGLQHAVSFIRREVARRLQLRFAIDLMFVLDASWKRGSRVDELLEQIHAESAQTTPTDANDGTLPTAG